MGAPSATAARLLPADGTTRVRFIPEPNFNGEVKLFFRAWDQTQGAPGTTMTTVGNLAGTKSLSGAYDIAILNVLPVNDRPLLTLGGTVTYAANAPAVTVADAAVVTDIDSPTLSGGQLRVWIAGGAGASNRLGIGGEFTVDAGNNVKFGSLTIGQRTSNGEGTNDLIIQLNANVTPDLAQLLVRSVRFSTVGGSAGARNVRFTLSDGDGGLSAERFVTVNVT
jgi:hypothetical protein